MKQSITILLLFVLIGCRQTDQKEDVLSGRIINRDDQSIELTYFKEYFNNNRVVLDIVPDEQQHFSLPIEFQEAFSAGLRIGRVEVPLFIEPGDALKMEADASAPLETTRFEGKGSDNNNFLLAFYRDFELKSGDRFIAVEAGKRDADGFAAMLDSISELKKAFFHVWQQEHSLTPAFNDYMLSKIRYDHYAKLLDYPILLQRASQTDGEVEIPASYYSFLHDESLIDDSKLEHQSYVNFLMSLLSHYSRQKPASLSNDEASLNQQTYYLAAEALGGRSRDYIQAMMVGRELSYGELADAAQLYADFITSESYEGYKDRLRAIYEVLQALTAGNPAPDFTMTAMNGEEVSLSDLRGKVVFMDFWASWCGPCMREMPHVKALKEIFSNEEDLVFVYISIDTDVEAWKNAVERLELRGVHFNTSGRERGVPSQYNVKWIPAFYIIGRDGNIFDNRPPMPSSGGLQARIQEALGQNS